MKRNVKSGKWKVRHSVRRVGVGRWVHQVRTAGIAFVKNGKSFLAGVGFMVLVYLAMRMIGG